MAYGDNSTINTNELAMATNKFVNKKTIDLVQESSFLVWYMLGEDQDLNVELSDPSKASVPQPGRITLITGKELEVRWRAELDSPAILANASSEIAAVSLSLNEDKFLGGTADIAHVHHHVPLPMRYMERLKGGEAKGVAWYQEELAASVATMYDFIATGLNSDNTQSASTIGGWDYAISSDNVYYDIDRSDAGNTMFLPYEDTTASALTRKRLSKMKINLKGRGAQDLFAVCDEATYAEVIELVEGKSQVIQNDAKMLKFGGDCVRYSNVTFGLEPKAPATKMAYIDASQLKVVVGAGGVQTDLVERAHNIKAGGILFLDAWVGTAFTNTRRCGKFEGYTVS